MKSLKKLSALAVSILMLLSFAGCQSINNESKADSTGSNAETSTDANSSKDSGNSKSNKTDKNFKNGVYSTDEYSIEIGSEWVKSDDLSNDDTAVFTNSTKSYSSINIRQEHQHGESKISSKEYKKSAVEQFNSMDGYKVTSTKNVKIDGNDAFIIYLDMNSSSTKMKLIQCYILDEQDIFVYSFLTSADQYNKMKSQAEKILKSFKVL